MKQAYERELKLLPIVIDMEQQGVPLSTGIHDLLATWEDVFDDGEQYIQGLIPDDVKIGHHGEEGELAGIQKGKYCRKYDKIIVRN